MLSKRMYSTILLLIISMFIMFMLTSYSIKNSGNIESSQEKQITISSEEMILEKDLDMSSSLIENKGKTRVAIINNGLEEKNDKAKILKEFCIYNKYPYKVFNYFPSSQELYSFDLILFGDLELELEKLQEYSRMGITMFFTKLPDYKSLDSQNDLARFFGIQNGIEEEVETDGLKIFSGFMIGSERIYEKDDYFGEEDDASVKVPYYSLLPGFEVYSVGILDNQKELGIKDENLPPLLWKTKTNNSFVFVVNAQIFHDSSLLGILTGFKSKEKNFHIYPLVNGHTISVVNFPYLSNEREEEIERIYGRSTQVLVRDLLFPNIIQILKNYGDSSNFFFASQLNYNKKEAIHGDLKFYIDEVNKLSGEIGVSLSQKSEKSIEAVVTANEIFFSKNLPGYRFRNLYLGEFSEEELRRVSHRNFFENITLVTQDYSNENYLLSCFNQDILSLSYNLNGYKHETLDDLRMLSIENALGMCNVSVDLSKVFYPDTPDRQWNSLSLAWAKGKTYFNDFKVFDFLSVNVLETRIRRFLSLDYTYSYDEESLELHIDHFDQEAFFMFSVYEKEIESVKNADIKKVSQDVFLIKANDADISIRFRELAVLDAPSNNKLIPYDAIY